MTSTTKLMLTGDGRRITIDNIVKCFKDIRQVSLPTNGSIQRLSDNRYSIKTNYSALDCENIEEIKTSKFYSLNTKLLSKSEKCIESLECVSGQNYGSNENSEVCSAVSLNGNYLARLKKKSSPDNPNFERQLLEIWNRSRLIKTIDFNDIEQHGAITTDPHFSSFRWSPFANQDKLLYICQAKKPKHKFLYKKSKEGDDEEGESKYLQQQTWGEAMGDISHTILAVLDIENDCSITTIEVPNASLGSSQWMDNGKIVSQVNPETPKRLGVVYCNNRPSHIVVHDILSKKQIVRIMNEAFAFHTPRVNNLGDSFIFLKNDVYGAHEHSVKIQSYDMKTSVIRQYDKELFISELPKTCFTSDNNNILFVNKEYSGLSMCIFNLEKSALTKVKFPTSGVSISDFKYDIILAKGFDFNATPTLFVAILNSTDGSDVVSWHQMDDCVHLNELEYEFFKIATDDNKSFISGFMLRPNLPIIQKDYPLEENDKLILDPNKLPTVVMVHGGPHSIILNSYMPIFLMYARMGLKCLIINYRGSTGVSESYLQSLCGHIGDLDITDCLTAIRHFVGKNLIDSSNLIISGGSHGGFIACHLSCQTDFRFTSAIIRNPVVDMASMYQVTDIPDWCYNEALGHKHYGYGYIPTSEHLNVMYQRSPFSKVDKANVPTCMLLGAKDKRVPIFAAERWVEIIKYKGIDTVCKIFDDKHDLAKPETELESIITIFPWVLQHLKN